MNDGTTPRATARSHGELLYLPLGGTGEIGMNLNLYGFNGRWLMVDLGIGFGDDSTPHVEVMMPDPTFIAERADKLDGLVLTHAHEDHLGAVQYLWPRLKCPVYATPFAAAVLRRKLEETGLAKEVRLEVVPQGSRFQVGAFDLRFLTVTHSIPEPNALAIRTAHGLVLHTGDWKLDPEPLIGPTTDEAAFAALGEEGVLAMVCDSTNILRPGEAGSEAEVRRSLTELIGRCRKRVAVTCFATNVARVESIAAAAAANDRHVALVGRSLWRINAAARETGYLKRVPEFLTEHDVGYLPEDKAVMICTGSQGEPGSALWRIAAEEHPEVSLGAGDTVIFSSRIIPGNERSIGRLHNRLLQRGVTVITEKDHFVHVSGHPARDEVAHLYRLVKPRLAIPTHGEWRHLAENAAVAREAGVPQALVIEDGEMVRLAPGPPEVVDRVPTGRLALDGDGRRLLPLGGPVLQARRRMMFNGAVTATLVVDEAGRLLAEPQIAAQGLIDGEAEGAAARARAIEALRSQIESLPRPARADDAALKEAARQALNRIFRNGMGKRPLTEIHLVRL